ncbi:MAG: hypothetical protein LC098_00560 [Burkholderiales bacterium]|nr:hypothetical protein [Burkholderiales bacterium]
MSRIKFAGGEDTAKAIDPLPKLALSGICGEQRESGDFRLRIQPSIKGVTMPRRRWQP